MVNHQTLKMFIVAYLLEKVLNKKIYIQDVIIKLSIYIEYINMYTK